ncbi:hypothetical protein GCM10027444_10290 [Actinopolyspora lacussalsi]
MVTLVEAAGNMRHPRRADEDQSRRGLPGRLGFPSVFTLPDRQIASLAARLTRRHGPIVRFQA